MGKYTDYTVLSSPQRDDILLLVDVHDSTQSAQGTSKQATLSSVVDQPWQFRPETFGAKGDGKIVADGAMTVGGSGTILTCATTAPFTSADVGKAIHVGGAGGAVLTPLITTIASFQSATQVTLSAACTSTVTTSIVAWGTDDTAAINQAVTQAYAFAGSSGLLYAEVVFSKLYVTASACTVGGGTLGNAQIPLPVNAPGATSNKVTLAFVGVVDAAVLVHWQSGAPKMPGPGIMCIRNDGTVDGTFGTAHVIGGPFNGYGNGGTNFSNMKFVIKGMSVITPYNGTIGAIDVQGVAEASGYSGASSVLASPGGQSGGGAGAGVPSMNNTSIATITNFGRFGFRMPAVNNNAVCTLSFWTMEGFSAGLGASEHTSASFMEINYCYNAIWAYDAVSIAHWISIRHVVAGECVNFLLASGSGGTTKKIKIDVASMESIGTVINDSNNTFIGEVYIGKINNTTISLTGGSALRVIDLSAIPGFWTGAPAAPTQAVAQQNTSGRDATVYVTSTAAITAVAVTGDDLASHAVFSGSIAAGGLVTVDVPSYKSYTVTSAGGTLTTHWVKR